MSFLSALAAAMVAPAYHFYMCYRVCECLFNLARIMLRWFDNSVHKIFCPFFKIISLFVLCGSTKVQHQMKSYMRHKRNLFLFPDVIVHWTVRNVLVQSVISTKIPTSNQIDMLMGWATLHAGKEYYEFLAFRLNIKRGKKCFSIEFHFFLVVFLATSQRFYFGVHFLSLSQSENALPVQFRVISIFVASAKEIVHVIIFCKCRWIVWIGYANELGSLQIATTKPSRWTNLWRHSVHLVTYLIGSG